MRHVSEVCCEEKSLSERFNSQGMNLKKLPAWLQIQGNWRKECARPNPCSNQVKFTLVLDQIHGWYDAWQNTYCKLMKNTHRRWIRNHIHMDVWCICWAFPIFLRLKFAGCDPGHLDDTKVTCFPNLQSRHYH